MTRQFGDLLAEVVEPVLSLEGVFHRSSPRLRNTIAMEGSLWHH
jgi:hypothetical protein